MRDRLTDLRVVEGRRLEVHVNEEVLVPQDPGHLHVAYATQAVELFRRDPLDEPRPGH